MVLPAGSRGRRAGRHIWLQVTGEPELVNGSCQRLRKSWHFRDRREVGQFARGRCIEGDARRHRFARGLRPSSAPPLEELARRARRQLGQTESQNAKRRAEVFRHLARKIVGRAARRADHEDFRERRTAVEEIDGGCEAGRGGGQSDDAKHIFHLLPDAMPEARGFDSAPPSTEGILAGQRRHLHQNKSTNTETTETNGVARLLPMVKP